MKALSLRQPWAELVLQGKKTIETRKWNTSFRGEFFVHASGNVDEDACLRFKFDPDKLRTGCLVGRASLIGVIKYDNKEQFLKDSLNHLCSNSDKFPVYGFMLVNPVRIKPVKHRGCLNFFEA